MVLFSCRHDLYHEIKFELTREHELYLMYLVCSHQPIFLIKNLINSIKDSCTKEIQVKFAKLVYVSLLYNNRFLFFYQNNTIYLISFI